MKFVQNVVNYTCKNTEQLGIMVEKTICGIVNTKFNTKRKYIDIPETIESDVNDSIGPILKRMKMKHTGHLNTEYDFKMGRNKTVSIKTIMSGNKICPQTIGQCSLASFNNKMNMSIMDKISFKRFFLENKGDMVKNYLENVFCCDTMVVFKFQTGIIYIIEKTGNKVEFKDNCMFDVSRDLLDWNESNTVYIIPKRKNAQFNRVSLGEIQIHNNRDCIKFRFNLNTLVDMINSGDIKNLRVNVYNLKNKYNFKVSSDMGKEQLCFRSFNYIGSKMKLLDFIESKINEYTGKELKEHGSFADIFSGTGVVAYHSLKRGCKKILTNDIQHYAYIVSSVWTTSNINISKVKELLMEINEVNESVTEQDAKDSATDKDFIYNNYTEAGESKRMYLTKLNGYRIDKTRQKLQNLVEENVINDDEFRLMLKVLLYAVTSVSNIASVYGAYLKKYKACAKKILKLDISLVDTLNKCQNKNMLEHKSYNKNVIDLLEENSLSDYDIVYIDPPYVANRSYHDNYHLLETISKYDYPKIKGKTGLRDETVTKSKFCSKKDALGEFRLVLGKIKSKYVFISYSSESIISKEKMIEILKENWNNVVCYEKEYQRFKSNKGNNNTQPKTVTEYLFCATLTHAK